MSARDLHTKLEGEHSVHMAAVRTLEHERTGLLLAKHSGDAKAAKRSMAIRQEMEERAAAVREIVQLQAGLRPRMRREKAADERAVREKAAADLDREMAALEAYYSRIDMAIDLLATAVNDAAPVLEHTRLAAARQTMPPCGDDVGHASISLMMALHTSHLRELPELIERRLLALHVLEVLPGEHEAAPSMLEVAKLARKSVMARVSDRIRVDQQQAEADAAEMEAELAGAAALEPV